MGGLSERVWGKRDAHVLRSRAAIFAGKPTYQPEAQAREGVAGLAPLACASG